MGCSLSVDLLKGEHPEILAGIGEGHVKSGFRRTEALISLKRGKIGPKSRGISAIVHCIFVRITDEPDFD